MHRRSNVAFPPEFMQGEVQAGSGSVMFGGVVLLLCIGPAHCRDHDHETTFILTFWKIRCCLSVSICIMIMLRIPFFYDLNSKNHWLIWLVWWILTILLHIDWSAKTSDLNPHRKSVWYVGTTCQPPKSGNPQFELFSWSI